MIQNINLLNKSGLVLVLFTVSKLPASENNLSLAVEQAYTDKYFLASKLKIGNFSSCLHYQINGLLSKSISSN